jgi:hypothetical protein
VLLIFILSRYRDIEESYLDLVDSDDVDQVTLSVAAQVTPLLKPTAGFACHDDSGWIEEWILSGVMPPCSLAHRSTVDILYT